LLVDLWTCDGAQGCACPKTGLVIHSSLSEYSRSKRIPQPTLTREWVIEGSAMARIVLHTLKYVNYRKPYDPEIRYCSGFTYFTDMYSRRSVVAGSALIMTSLAGCVDELGDDSGSGGSISSAGGGVDPQVTDVEIDQDFFDTIGGSADVRVLVANDGDAGDVEVTVTAYDDNDNTIERFTEEAYIQEEETKRVDLSIEIPDGAESADAEVSPA